MSDVKFIDGFWANKPHEKAPGFVKCEISIDLKRFFEWAKEWKASNPDEKYLKITTKESKKGEFYSEVNEWKPEQKQQQAAVRTQSGELDSDIPF